MDVVVSSPPPQPQQSAGALGNKKQSIGSKIDVSYAKLDEQARRYLVEQTHEIIIPSYSAWFDMTAIHDVERDALPEFFSGRNKSKSPAVYKEYRDFMINAYRLNPSEYLTLTACRRNLAGDVCAVMRVHAFLEQWGLINYHVDPDTRPAPLVPPFTGHFRVTADTPRGLQPFLPAVQHAPSSTATNGVTPATASVTQTTTTTTVSQTTTTTTVTPTTATTSTAPASGSANGTTNLALRSDAYDPADSIGSPITTSTTTTHSYHCHTCQADCTQVRYHNASSASPTMHLCEPCYLDGRYPSTLFSGDFVRLVDVQARVSGAHHVHSAAATAAGHTTNPTWTEPETLLLLEGVEMYDHDWSAVAQHVGTKTRDQCILQFLRLPIQDPYVGVEASKLGGLQFHRPPMSEADNPVLTLVAFLAQAVDKHVATGVADKARELVGGQAAHALDVHAATAVGLTAARAQMAVSEEEQAMAKCVRELVDLQSRKVDLKLAALDRIEAALDAERRALEREKVRVFLDRLALKKPVEQLAMSPSSAARPTAPGSARVEGAWDGVQRQHVEAESPTAAAAAFLGL
ncbi:hypothetical protein BCR44DRAFT_1386026 [Catenaria anguillulae PL171]|uniref:SWIRM domain-domain-containing protein n=1 Tax=Catenaria anguillulae PL171 TaxID=765915 RepID=A0A1Y2I1J1_9FUNG|nr:hypothetical protein BCR44DRAFT_1386026 [Catenaria anguillulae PL171]